MSKENFDNNVYCPIDTANKAVAGKNILLAIFNGTGAKLLAVAGQQGLTINRSAESIDTSSKDTVGGWMSKITGMKEWSVDIDGLYSQTDETQKELEKYFNNGDPVCLKVINAKTKKGMFGGLAVITDYSLEAPHDDSMTYSISLEGNGALINLLDESNEIEDEHLPQGMETQGEE